MNDFNRKMEETGARVSKKVSDAAERLEKESADLIAYLNRRSFRPSASSPRKRCGSRRERLRQLADFMDENKNQDPANKP